MTREKLDASKKAMIKAIKHEERVGHTEPTTDYQRLNILVADFMSKLREAECEGLWMADKGDGEISDDEFCDGLALIEHYLWTGKVAT